MFLQVIEGALAVLVFLVLVTQVIWPLAVGRPLFPFFREGRKLEGQLGQVRDQVDNAELKKTIETEREKL